MKKTLAVLLVFALVFAIEAKGALEEQPDAVVEGYSERHVLIPVPEIDGIPAHEIPAIVTVPIGGGPFPAMVMLHGTGSDKSEAGGGYDLAAPAMALEGIASIRLDFIGSGESTASYADYCYTSANLDAKAAADHMAGLKTIDGSKIGVMGWSQGGTNALLAAAAYPETFNAVITWAGAMRLDDADFFEDWDAARATAKAEGYVPLVFDWRDWMPLGARWFDEVESTDMMEVVASIPAPILAINGLSDTTVYPDNARAIVKAAKNPKTRAFFIEDCDHTYNIFTGDTSTMMKCINAGIDFIHEVF